MLLIVLLLVVIAQTPLVQAPRDEPRTETERGTAIVRGRVVDAETGGPLARVTVTLYISRVRTILETTTDTAGAFEFTGVPAGEYVLSADPTANRTTHRPATYGAPASSAAGAAPKLVVRAGDVIEKADISLPRSLVISGRVFDENGEPVADARVEAERLEPAGGPPQRVRTTDDLGGFRLWGLAPGAYRVCVTPLAGGPDRQAGEGLVRTCHPSVPESEAQPVVLTDANSPELDIRLRRARLFRITGVVIDASGTVAPGASVTFGTMENEASITFRSMPNEAGTFTVRGVPPGEYFVTAQLGNAFNADDRDRQLGYTPITVQSADIDNVVVAMVPPATVRGRLLFDGAARPPAQALTVRALPAMNSMGARAAPSTRPSTVKPDFSFELRGLFGPHTLQVEGARGWVIKSVQYRGEDRAHVPTEFRPASDVEIVLTARTARLIARVLDEKGQPVDGARAIIFPADSRQWDAADAARFGVRRDGIVEFTGVRAAEYLVAALPPGQAFPIRDRKAYDALSKRAERITLLENDQRTIDLVFRN